MTKRIRKRDFLALLILVLGLGINGDSQVSVTEKSVRASLSGILMSTGYEVTNRKAGSGAELKALEERDASRYGPSSRMFISVRSVHEWRREAGTHFRYWLARETYDSEELAVRRVREYLTDFPDRLSTPSLTSHMVSKTIIRVGARRRNKTVYLLVTDGAYTLYDDKQRESLLKELESGGP